ncbi:MAG: hypothetical protein K8R02_02780 [Anaerohalosphaeraceae bacterium]|nr:hypothetical protein [Anaerohalosphaeraceae bacterium]
MPDEILQNQRQTIEKFIRQDSPANQEHYRVISTGKGGGGFVAKIISKEYCNHYNLTAVEIGQAGTIPVAMGGLLRAVNVAEPFLSQGTLAAGTFVIVSRAGDKYVFSRPV